LYALKFRVGLGLSGAHEAVCLLSGIVSFVVVAVLEGASFRHFPFIVMAIK
jgi:hypothetical protein